MPANQAQSAFAALVEPDRQKLHFEPLAPIGRAPLFEELVVKLPTAQATDDPSPETYQRIQAATADHTHSILSTLSVKDREIDELREALAARDMELKEAKASYEIEMSQAVGQSHAALSKILHDGLAAIESRMTDKLSSEIAIIIEPFVEAEIRGRVLDEFYSMLSKCLTKGDMSRVTLQGPRDLVSAVREAYSDKTAQLTLIESDTHELSIETDSKLISTRLEHWSRLLTGRAKNEPR